MFIDILDTELHFHMETIFSIAMEVGRVDAFARCFPVHAANTTPA
ncbi:hypothetical protein [uncultured Oxalicibacterium sp.]|nr:hypothetical protein [uncultured Oxalicibacterium sp.]